LKICQHAADLWHAYSANTEDRIWTYLPYGPFPTQLALAQRLTSQSASADPLFFAIVDNSNGKALGIATYLRIQP